MKRICTLLVAATLLLAACGKPEDKFVGHYDGTMEMPQEMIDLMKSMAPQFGEDPSEMEAKLSNLQIGMELRGDGTCSMTNESDGKTDLTEGTWTLNEEGTQITVQLTEAKKKASALGMPTAGEDLVLDVSEDGKTLSI